MYKAIFKEKRGNDFVFAMLLTADNSELGIS